MLNKWQQVACFLRLRIKQNPSFLSLSTCVKRLNVITISVKQNNNNMNIIQTSGSGVSKPFAERQIW